MCMSYRTRAIADQRKASVGRSGALLCITDDSGPLHLGRWLICPLFSDMADIHRSPRGPSSILRGNDNSTNPDSFDLHFLHMSMPSIQFYFFNNASKASMTLSPTSLVPLFPPRSLVLNPSSKTFLTACSIRSASGPLLREYRRSIATERIVPMGFAIP